MWFTFGTMFSPRNVLITCSYLQFGFVACCVRRSTLLFAYICRGVYFVNLIWCYYFCSALNCQKLRCAVILPKTREVILCNISLSFLPFLIPLRRNFPCSVAHSFIYSHIGSIVCLIVYCISRHYGTAARIKMNIIYVSFILCYCFSLNLLASHGKCVCIVSLECAGVAFCGLIIRISYWMNHSCLFFVSISGIIFDIVVRKCIL